MGTSMWVLCIDTNRKLNGNSTVVTFRQKDIQTQSHACMNLHNIYILHTYKHNEMESSGVKCSRKDERRVLSEAR